MYPKLQLGIGNWNCTDFSISTFQVDFLGHSNLTDTDYSDILYKFLILVQIFNMQSMSLMFNMELEKLHFC